MVRGRAASILGTLLWITPSAAFCETLSVVSILESGTWGWPTGEHTCQKNAQHFVFASDETQATIYWDHDLGPAVYRIERMTPYGFVAQIKGETRLTEQGEPVVWQLFLLGQGQFCWHRMDWPLATCTKPQVQCTTESPSS